MLRFAQIALSKLRRDRGQSLRVLIDKSVDYAVSTVTAPLFLWGATHVGARVRTQGGRPRIVNYGVLTIGDDVRITSHVTPVELAVGEGAELHIGAGSQINYGVSVGATRSVHIGARVRLGPYSRIVDSDFHDAYDREKPATPKPVVIEDDVWLGMNAVVLPGVRIGRRSIVGTGAVVTADVPPFTVVGGVPARVLRTLDPSRFPDAPDSPRATPPA